MGEVIMYILYYINYIYIIVYIYIWQACYYWLYKIRSTPQPKCLPIGPIDTKILWFYCWTHPSFLCHQKAICCFFSQSASLCNERTLGPKSLRVFFSLDNESMPWSFLKRKNSNWVSRSKQSMAQWSISCLNPSHSRDVRTSIHFCTRLFQN